MKLTFITCEHYCFCESVAATKVCPSKSPTFCKRNCHEKSKGESKHCQ